MIGTLAATIMLIAGLGGFVSAARASRSRVERIAEVWKRAARLVGGQWAKAEGAWYTPKAGTIRAYVDHVDVTVVTDSKSATHANAEAPTAASLAIEVRPRELSLRSAADLPVEVMTGDESFDDAHIVATTHADLARAWMSPKVQRAIAASRPYVFRLGGGHVQVSRAHLEDDPDRLARVIRAAAVFAFRGKEIARAWSVMATKLEGETQSPLTLEGGEGSAIHFTRGSVTLTVSAEQALTTIRAGELRIDLPGVVTDVERIEAAIAGAGPTAPTVGPYR
jgi:hypothetical protein